MPQGIAPCIAMAGSIDQFTVVTAQVFLPLLYISRVGCTERGMDNSGDDVDNCTDPAPHDPNHPYGVVPLVHRFMWLRLLRLRHANR